jgi:hypothetical protein
MEDQMSQEKNKKDARPGTEKPLDLNQLGYQPEHMVQIEAIAGKECDSSIISGVAVSLKKNQTTDKI